MMILAPLEQFPHRLNWDRLLQGTPGMLMAIVLDTIEQTYSIAPSILSLRRLIQGSPPLRMHPPNFNVAIALRLRLLL